MGAGRWKLGVGEGYRGELSVEDFGDDEEPVSVVRGIFQDGLLGETLRDRILADHVKDRDCMSRRFDACDIEFVHLLNVIENPSDLWAEDLDLFGSNFQPCKAGQVGNVDGVMG